MPIARGTRRPNALRVSMLIVAATLVLAVAQVHAQGARVARVVILPWWMVPAPLVPGDLWLYGYHCVPGTVCADPRGWPAAPRRSSGSIELTREFEVTSPGTPVPMRRPAPPPTPEAHLQPEYRGSGEVRPQYRLSGQPK